MEYRPTRYLRVCAFPRRGRVRIEADPEDGVEPDVLEIELEHIPDLIAELEFSAGVVSAQRQDDQS